jgi:hypothetical protein
MDWTSGLQLQSWNFEITPYGEKGPNSYGVSSHPPPANTSERPNAEKGMKNGDVNTVWAKTIVVKQYSRP